MLQERINRVINNHQLSCEHRSHYLFILKGFTEVLNRFSVPVEDLDVNNINGHSNYFVTYEDALTLGSGITSQIIDKKYDIWIVDFNLFENGYLANEAITEYTECKPWHHYYFVNYPDLPLKYKVLSIFNTDNPLIGLVDDPEEKRDNEQRLALFETMK